jgi:PAS domain S-box-containing protein
MQYVSPGCRDLTGFDAQDLEDNRVVAYATLIHPADRNHVREAVQGAVEEAGSFRVTYRIRRADGRERLVWEQGCAVVGDDGKVDAVEGFVTDVSEQVELSHRLTEQEAQFRALVEQSLAGVYVVRDGRMAYVNQRYADILGYSAEEVVSMESFHHLIHPDDREMAAEQVRRRVEGETSESRYEVRLVRKDGETRDIEAHGRRINLDGAPAIMGLLIDVTQRKREQRRYHDAQKLEALGRLASGVAHDLNNFLTLIKLTAQLMMAERVGDAKLQEDLAEIVGTVDRGAALGRELMHFGSPRSRTESSSSLETIISGLGPILGRALGPGVELRIDVEPGLPHVSVGPANAEEIVMNLVVNARDAMPNGGTLTVSARAAAGDPAAGDVRGLHHVVLEVADNGVGIEPSARKLLFEPYYTTKGERGTGLGLANVWRIATDAGGIVGIDSEPGHGSTFSVFLPIAPRPEETTP